MFYDKNKRDLQLPEPFQIFDDIKTVDVKTGHDYETKYASKTDGTVTQTCKSCGYVNKFTVPTSTLFIGAQTFRIRPFQAY